MGSFRDTSETLICGPIATLISDISKQLEDRLEIRYIRVQY